MSSADSVNQEKLMQITCMCNVEKNGFIDKEIQTGEKNKVLQVFRISKTAKGGEEHDLRFLLKYQKSMDLALEFHLKDINGVFSQAMSQGLLTLTLSMKS